MKALSPTAQRAQFLMQLLGARLPAERLDWVERSAAELEAGVAAARFCALISQASRLVSKQPLSPSPSELARARELLEDWSPERWTQLETARVRLVLAHAELEREGGVAALEEAFQFADMGELCALYRSLALCPDPERFARRAGEGARSNMCAVFEATCCDTPYPALWFDDIAWRQAVIKSLFVGAPLWRIRGLDKRLDAELARMALDLSEERHSAGRRIYPELLLCLGAHGGQRGLELVERLFAQGDTQQRCAAALALARAGQSDRLRSLAAVERDQTVEATCAAALSGEHDQSAFAALSAQAKADAN